MSTSRKHFLRHSLLAGLGLAGARQLLAAGNRSPVSPLFRGSETPVVVNAGIAGNTTTNLIKRIDTDCLAHKPELVIMMVGTNDMANGKHVAPDKYKSNLLWLAEKIQQSGARLLMMTILPFYEPYLLTRHPAEFFQPEGAEGRRKQVNQIIQDVASTRKADLLDISSIFEKVGKVGTDADSLIRNEANSGKTDGVHPTRDGYRFLALAVSQYIQYHQLPTGTIVCFGDSITKGDGSIDKESYPAYLAKLLS